MYKKEAGGFTRTNFTRNLNGFTLIEVLIAAVIILVFSGISLAGYRQFSEKKKLEEEAQKLAQTFEIAKQKAISGEKGNCTSKTANGYFGVFWGNDPSRYFLEEGVDPMPDGCEVANYYKIYLPKNIIFTTKGEVFFHPFGYRVVAAGFTAISNDRYIATLKNTITNKSMTVFINKSGLITVLPWP